MQVFFGFFPTALGYKILIKKPVELFRGFRYLSLGLECKDGVI